MEYAEDMLIFASNEKVIHPAGWKLIPDVKKAKAKIKSFIDRNADEWAIALKVNGGQKIIGWIGMHKVNLKGYNFSLDFGYGLAEEYWGQGIAAEASKKLMHYAFIGLKCDAMTVSHKVFNNRSKRVIEKCGFNLRGIYPKNNQDNPDSNACYSLSRIDYINMFNILESDEYGDVKNILLKYKPKPRKEKSPQKYDPRQPKQTKGSPYSINNPVRIIDGISWIKEPTGYLCGQSCVAMLAAVSVDEVIKIMGTDKGTGYTHIRKALNYYGIRYAPINYSPDPNDSLPELCMIVFTLPKYRHWSLYYKGVFYDPEFGVINEYPPNALLSNVWEIFP